MPLTNITKRLESTLYLCSAKSYSNNLSYISLCQNCYGTVRTNKYYRSVEILARSSRAIRCHRCNACTIAYLMQEYSIPVHLIQESIKENKSIVIRDHNVRLTLT